MPDPDLAATPPYHALPPRWTLPRGLRDAAPSHPVLWSFGIVLPLIALFGLLGEWTYLVFPPGTYVTFHDVVELFAVIVALSIFGVGWYTRDHSRDRHALFLACAFLAIGLGDFLHTLSYVGRPAFLTPSAPNKASYVWIVVRLFGAAAFLAAAGIDRRSTSRWLDPAVLLGGAAAATLGFLGVLLFHDRLPPVFVAGIGQTPLKRGAEAVVVVVTLLAVWAYQRRQARDGEAFVGWLSAGLVVCALSELPFASYRTATDSLNALGHVLKVAGFALVYRGLFIASVQEPYRREAEGRRALAEESANRLEAEAQLRQAQKLDAVGQLAGGVAHDFNNLLTAIIGGAEALAESLPRGDPRRADVEDIRGAADRAAALTRQLLAFSRKQVLAPELLDLDAVVSDFQRLLSRTLGDDIAMEVSLSSGPLPILADRGQLEQVLLNLSVNARDAMPMGGRLTLATSRREASGAAPADEPPRAWAVLEVRDTGCGMTPEVRAHLFEPFFTTKGPGKGTGLGLSTVYGIVQQAGGTVEVATAPGQGTTFRVILPCHPGALPAPPPARPRERATGDETILLAEDHPMVRRATVRALERAGYRVVQAADGAEALRTAGGRTAPVHLLLTDVNMPHLDGIQLALELRRRWPGLPVVFMTGFTERSSGLDLAGARLIHKPFTPERLLEEVRAALDAR